MQEEWHKYVTDKMANFDLGNIKKTIQIADQEHKYSF